VSGINPWLTIITLLSLLFYVVTSAAVGHARAKHKVAAPAMVGPPAFERAVRVQANTLEWLPIYLPSLWLFAAVVNAPVAVALGAVWLVGRIIYMAAYLGAADKRGLGFTIQFLAAMALVFGGLIGAVVKLISSS